MGSALAGVLVGGVLVGGVLVGGAAFAAPPTDAAPVRATVGYRDQSHAGTIAPTAEKPQSKLWFHAGAWWGVLFRPSAHGGKFTIHRLDRQRWIDTGVAVDTRENVHLDALSHGDELYVASSRGSPNPKLDRKVRVWGYTYDGTAKTYHLDRGFPVTIADGDVEAVVIDRDSTGKLWATFVLNGRVMVTHSTGGAGRWVAPYVLPVGDAATVRAEPQGDQSALVAYGGGRVGIMFSSQIDPSGIGVMYWATHTDGADDRSWGLAQAFAGPRLADEHINLKALPEGDRAGSVVAAVKTSQHGHGTRAVVHLLRLRADGTWTSHRFGTVAENHTRPLVQVDIDHRRVYVFAVSPCCRGDVVYMKSSSLDTLSFPPGRGTPFIASADDVNLNNPTGTKQLLGNASGLVVLAGDDVTHTYLHNSRGMASSPAPPAAHPSAAVQATQGGHRIEPSAMAGTAPEASQPIGADTGGARGADVTPTTRREPAALPTALTRQVYFGWFSKFIAYTGLDVLVLVNVAASALCLGGAAVFASRRRLGARVGVRR